MRRRTAWLAAVAAVLVVALVAGLAGIRAYRSGKLLVAQLEASFSAGQQAADQGKALLKQATTQQDPSRLPAAEADFQRSQADFAGAGALVRASRLVGLMASLPGPPGAYVGERVDAAENLAAIGSDLADAGLQAALAEGPLLKSSSGSASGLKSLITTLNQASPMVTKAAQDLKDARARSNQVDPAVLPASFRSDWATVEGDIQKGLAGVEQFQSLVPALTEFLGYNGPRTYLIEQANPGELRAGGGFLGTYTVIRADQGTISVVASGDTHTLADFGFIQGQAGYVSPPATMKEFLTNKGWSLSDSNFYPDFPSNAQAAESFAQKDFGGPLNGVISIDLYAVQTMLGLTGPMTVPGYGVTLNSGNLLNTLIPPDVTQNPIHKLILAALAGPLVHTLTSLPARQWPATLSMLNSLATQRHLQAFFNDQALENEMVSIGWSGGYVSAPKADYLFAVESNFGGNKANWYLTRAYTLTLTRDGANLDHQLVVNLSLDAASAPYGYVEDYRAYFRLITGSDASNLKIQAVKSDDYPNPAPAGHRMVDGWQQLNVNRLTRTGTLTITYTWTTPWSGAAGAPQKIYWQKQPGTAPDSITVRFVDGSSSWTASGNLASDRLITISPGKVSISAGQQGTAELPSLG